MSLSEEIVLPSGLRLPNRLAKAAMAETMSDDGNPDENFSRVYKEWAEGGWGMIITGNVQVSSVFLGGPKDVHVKTQTEASKAAWKEYATATQSTGTPGIVQICHPGRQSPLGAGKRGFFTKTLAPSPVKLNMGDSLVAKALTSFAFGTPKEMSVKEIDEAIEQFVECGRRCFEAGWKGIELHGAHGYLLAQFLSPLTNLRTDEFGGTPEKRAEIVLRIVRRTRAATSKNFTIGMKFNSVDVSESADISDTMKQIKLIAEEGIDFLELSGGTYEDPKMMGEEKSAPTDEEKKAGEQPSKRTLERESFFLEFAKKVREQFPSLVLMVTGGFRTRLGMQAALESGGCDLIGIGRPATIWADLPKKVILNEEIKDGDAVIRLTPIVLKGVMAFVAQVFNYLGFAVVGTGAKSLFYAEKLSALGK